MNIFLEINQHINLSALRTESACWTGNVLDSLAFLELNFGSPQKILDLGTGGGFPLLPLAIALPDTHFTGLDAVGKKIKAVQGISKKLQLKNVELVNGRSEELGRMPAHREKYDAVLSRAVAPLRILLEWCSSFVKVDGSVVVWKSLQIEEELKESEHAQKECCMKLEKQQRYTLPGDFGERQLLIFRKTAVLSRTYPRPVGMAKKMPL